MARMVNNHLGNDCFPFFPMPSLPATLDYVHYLGLLVINRKVDYSGQKDSVPIYLLKISRTIKL
jgi:hypothetical protein